MTLSRRFVRNVYGGGVQEVSDLNTLHIATDSGSQALVDNTIALPDGSVEVVFRDLEPRLRAFIEQAEVVVGCVAWMTSLPLLATLAERLAVSIVVQKEDFLRPDGRPGERWAEDLRLAYERLPDASRYWFPGPLGSCSICGDPTLHAVRCVGNHNADVRATQPRMHNKFLIACRLVPKGEVFVDEDGVQYDERPHSIEPIAVWTGSFNLTRTAVASFENAVILRQPELVDAYLAEFCQIAALSEPLDWDSPWVEPEWRIGT